jgi:hypothetical protein
MKPFLVDVPVALDVFVRPDTLKLVFESIKKARPSILFLISDGPRPEIISDIENIKKSREIVNNIDWECTIYRLYFETNQGMYTKGAISKKFIFNKVDRCIFLEDDIFVSVSFFKFCAELLEKYKDDLRVHYITGMNYLGNYNKPIADYFFCAEGSIWGWATWRRTFEQYNHDYKYDKYILKSIMNLAEKDKKKYSRKILGYVNNNDYNGHVAATEYYKNILKYSQNQLFIVPKKNMVCCLGNTKGSTHGPDSILKIPKALQRIYNMKTYEYSFPLKNPQYLVRDEYYEKEVDKIMAWNNDVKQIIRRIEVFFRHIYFRDFDRINKKLVQLYKKQIEK